MFSKPIRCMKITMFLKLRSDSAAVRAKVYFYECYSVPKTSLGLNPFVIYVKDILLRREFVS